MATDTRLTIRRFEELEAKADALAQKKLFEFRDSQNGKAYFTIPSGPFKQWDVSVLNLLERIFGADSIHYQQFHVHFMQFSKWESQFEDCRAIFAAAREDFEGGYLFKVRSLAKAEVLSDALVQAKELLRAGYKDPACILARVALESTLKEIADRYGVQHGTLDRMNADLSKASAYNLAKQTLITAWAEYGNAAAHGRWDAYNDSDAQAMLTGVEALVADLL